MNVEEILFKLKPRSTDKLGFCNVHAHFFISKTYLCIGCIIIELTQS